MDTTKLTTVISLLIALSIASERLVDIIKGLVPWLNQQQQKPAEEGWRKATLQLLAVIAGITTAWLASAAIPKGVGIPDNWTGTLALGLLGEWWFRILEFNSDVRDKGQRSKSSRGRNQTNRDARQEGNGFEARPLTQTHCFADTLHDLTRDFIRAGRACFENVVDV